MHERWKSRLRTPVNAVRRVKREGIRPRDLAYAAPRSFSQFGEDRWLLRHFQDRPDGFWVDVGAFHPLHASNTYLLSRRGWSGINLEPQPGHLDLFRRWRPRDINLPYAVSTTRGTVTFAAAGAFGGIEDDTHLWKGIEGARVTVEARPLSEVLAEHLPPGRSIQLLDVDCEGHDLEVLKSNDWARFRPEVVLAEVHSDGPENVGAYLARLGYRRAATLELTQVFVDGEGA